MVLAHLRSSFWVFSHIKLSNMPKIIPIKTQLKPYVCISYNNTQASNHVHIITFDSNRLSVNIDNIV